MFNLAHKRLVILTILTTMALPAGDVFARQLSRDYLRLGAHDWRGASYFNPNDRDVDLVIKVRGNWTHRESYPHGPYGPDGCRHIAGGDFTLPGTAVGSLIARYRDRWILIGTGTTVRLRPGERIIFVMNENNANWDDNRGGLEIRATAYEAR